MSLFSNNIWKEMNKLKISLQEEDYIEINIEGLGYCIIQRSAEDLGTI